MLVIVGEHRKLDTDDNWNTVIPISMEAIFMGHNSIAY